MDFTTGTLQQQLAPQLITDYFPPPGGPSAVPPITLAYLNLDTSGATFQLNLQNQVLYFYLFPTEFGIILHEFPLMYHNLIYCSSLLKCSSVQRTLLFLQNLPIAQQQ